MLFVLLADNPSLETFFHTFFFELERPEKAVTFHFLFVSSECKIVAQIF